MFHPRPGGLGGRVLGDGGGRSVQPLLGEDLRGDLQQALLPSGE
ncbi:hypothetical protein ACFWZ2_08430 [Streptomyces sp. NPDC059002]